MYIRVFFKYAGALDGCAALAEIGVIRPACWNGWVGEIVGGGGGRHALAGWDRGRMDLAAGEGSSVCCHLRL